MALLPQLSIKAKLCTPLLAVHFEISSRQRRDEKGIWEAKAGRVAVPISHPENFFERLRVETAVSEGDDPFGSR